MYWFKSHYQLVKVYLCFENKCIRTGYMRKKMAVSMSTSKWGKSHQFNEQKMSVNKTDKNSLNSVFFFSKE